jgi:hypothetical protein
MVFFSRNEGRTYNKGDVVTFAVAQTPYETITNQGQITQVNGGRSYNVKDDQGNMHHVMHESILS